MSSNWKERYLELEKHAEKIGYRISECSDNKTKDYIGMNDLAAKDMGFPDMKHKQIIVDDNLVWRVKYHTLKHELVERKLMSEGDSYWKAHTVALGKESLKDKIEI